MITKEKYKSYFGVDTAPTNLERLEYLSINILRSVMTANILQKKDLIDKEFQKAIMEQIHYLDLNDDLIDYAGTGSYTLGSYSEGISNQNNDNSKSLNLISPVAHDILLNCGLLYCGLGGV